MSLLKQADGPPENGFHESPRPLLLPHTVLENSCLLEIQCHSHLAEHALEYKRLPTDSQIMLQSCVCLLSPSEKRMLAD